MAEIQIRGAFPDIASAQLPEFAAVAEEVLTSIRNEAGVLQYDVFVDDGRRAAVVLQRYADSEAVLRTLAATREHVRRLAQLGGGLRMEIFGDPSPQLRQVFAASHTASAAPTYSRLIGL